MRVVITGTSGFIGRHVVKYLLTNTDHRVRAVSGRTDNGSLEKNPNLEIVAGRDINRDTAWGDVLTQADTVLHLAARVHVLNDSAADTLTLYRQVNVAGTLNLGKQAVRAGIKRFVFISSIGVNGDRTARPFTTGDAPRPSEPYAVSKLEAEEKLRGLAQQTGLELVIIRPPLVYGPDAPGNFGRLIRIVGKGVPLPLGLVQNKRSLVAVDNLTDLIAGCLDHPAAAGQVFLVSDGRDLSTPELIRKMALAMNKSPRLLPVPPALLRMAGRITGKNTEIEKLIGSLQVDISHTCDTLGWRPQVSVEEALKKAVEGSFHDG